MNCTSPDVDGAPCGTCLLCRAHDVSEAVTDTVNCIIAELEDVQWSGMTRFERAAVDECIAAVKKWRAKQ